MILCNTETEDFSAIREDHLRKDLGIESFEKDKLAKTFTPKPERTEISVKIMNTVHHNRTRTRTRWHYRIWCMFIWLFMGSE